MANIKLVTDWLVALLTPLFGEAIAQNIVATAIWVTSGIILSFVVYKLILKYLFKSKSTHNTIIKVHIPIYIYLYLFLSKISCLFTDHDYTGFYYSKYKIYQIEKSTKGKDKIIDKYKTVAEVTFIYKNFFSRAYTGILFRRVEEKREPDDSTTNSSGKIIKIEALDNKKLYSMRLHGKYTNTYKILCGAWTDPTQPTEVAGTMLLRINTIGNSSKKEFIHTMDGDWRGYKKETPNIDMFGSWNFTLIASSISDYSKWAALQDDIENTNTATGQPVGLSSFVHFNPRS